MATHLNEKIRRKYPDHYTTQEVAELIGKSVDTMSRWRRQGKLVPTLRATVAGTPVWLYSHRDLERAKHLARTLRRGPNPRGEANAS